MTADSAAIARAIGGLLKAQDEVARALALVRALVDDAPASDRRKPPAPERDPWSADDTPVVVAPAGAAMHPPCPDTATYRAHQSYHRQRPNGTWGCAACDALGTPPPASVDASLAAARDA